MTFDHIMAKHTRVHWLAPTSMWCTFLAGTLLAIGHHLFYNSLDGKEASAARLHLGRLSYTEQQVNITIGTAFAYLVKASLVISVSIAYAQVFWRAFEVSSLENHLALRDIDTVFSALSNALALLNFPIWLKQPTLLLLATLAW